ncbi:MAG TPA: hypothetical protein VLS49_03770 [Usitatibacter sp.]|nr:hypothetical protein [Usitatibacter sp.]
MTSPARNARPLASPLAAETAARVCSYGDAELRTLLRDAAPTVAGAVIVDERDVACLYDTCHAVARRLAARAA